jgi:hypothetical protein
MLKYRLKNSWKGIICDIKKMKSECTCLNSNGGLTLQFLKKEINAFISETLSDNFGIILCCYNDVFTVEGVAQR